MLMAFGIDDALSAAAAGIELANTIVETIKRHRDRGKDPDIELLIEEVRLTALTRIDDADRALVKFERMLIDTNVDINKRITDVIGATPFWRPFQQHRLNQIHKSFNAFSDSLYSAGDDIAALLRCRGQTGEMGAAIADSAKRKQALREGLLYAPSLKRQIESLREELDLQKGALK
jgi:hypothetical protein